MKYGFLPKPICLLTNRLITFTKHGVYVKAPHRLWMQLSENSWIHALLYEFVILPLCLMGAFIFTCWPIFLAIIVGRKDLLTFVIIWWFVIVVKIAAYNKNK